VQFSINKPEEKVVITELILIEENEWHIWQLSCESELVGQGILLVKPKVRLLLLNASP
jgi:hypothetical protein